MNLSPVVNPTEVPNSSVSEHLISVQQLNEKTMKMETLKKIPVKGSLEFIRDASI